MNLKTPQGSFSLRTFHIFITKLIESVQRKILFSQLGTLDTITELVNHFCIWGTLLSKGISTSFDKLTIVLLCF